jgi:membrane-associated phospholipid phosphatase
MRTCIRVLALLAFLVPGMAAAAPTQRPAPSLPGVPQDVLAAAADLETAAPAATDSTCTWCVRERAKMWGPAVGLTAATLTVNFAASPPQNARWDSRNSFDNSIQDALGGDSSSTRNGAATASDVLLGLLGAGFATDVYLLRDEYPVEQSLMVGATMTAGNYLVTESAKVSAGRERPYVRHCRHDPGYVDSCNSGSDDNASFFSAHASESATLAGLVCARRLSRATVTWKDRLVCGGAAAASVTTGIMRITADEHYFTDVLAGWGSGVVFGAVIPLLLPEWSGIGDSDSTQSLTPLAGTDAVGFQYTSRF